MFFEAIKQFLKNNRLIETPIIYLFLVAVALGLGIGLAASAIFTPFGLSILGLVLAGALLTTLVFIIGLFICAAIDFFFLKLTNLENNEDPLLPENLSKNTLGQGPSINSTNNERLVNKPLFLPKIEPSTASEVSTNQGPERSLTEIKDFLCDKGMAFFRDYTLSSDTDDYYRYNITDTGEKLTALVYGPKSASEEKYLGKYIDILGNIKQKIIQEIFQGTDIDPHVKQGILIEVHHYPKYSESASSSVTYSNSLFKEEDGYGQSVTGLKWETSHGMESGYYPRLIILPSVIQEIAKIMNNEEKKAAMEPK